MSRVGWTREEMLRALCAYLSLELDDRKHPPKEFIDVLSRKLSNRSFASTALRIANFVSRDPEMQALGAKGMFGGGAHVDLLWDEFLSNGQIDTSKVLRAAAFEL